MSGSTGLSVSDVVQVSINLLPIAVPSRNFGALAILGSSNVIDVVSRIRQYTTLAGVATDFGTSAPEYLGADLFFSQSPQPAILYIARWAQTATAGELNGAEFSPGQQATLLTALQAVSAGAMTISVDGTPHSLTGLDFHLISNLNGAATVMDTALTAAADVVFDATFGRFVVTSHTSGGTSTVSYGTDPGSGAQVATLLGLTQASGASAPIIGQAAETPVAAIQALTGLNGDIYGLTFCTATPPTDTQYEACAAYVEGASPSTIFGITTFDPVTLDPAQSTDLGSVLKGLGYTRTFVQYSTSSPYAVCSMFARAFTVDFTANNTTITLKFKQEPGVTFETLNETQAGALNTKNVNVFVAYMNGAAIIQQGVMCSGIFFDERHNADWLQNQVQTDVFNLLFTSPTKIPQTDPGIHQIATTVEASLDRGVNNGMIAPGIWTSSLQFGVLQTGNTLAKGYYVFTPSVASQSQGDREARKAPTIQCAIKLAGAVHFANVAINVNR
jgi:hypothetical protein